MIAQPNSGCLSHHRQQETWRVCECCLQHSQPADCSMCCSCRCSDSSHTHKAHQLSGSCCTVPLTKYEPS